LPFEILYTRAETASRTGSLLEKKNEKAGERSKKARYEPRGKKDKKRQL